MIRKAMNECFYSLIHETHKFNGAAEILDILASIISGFAVPLRDFKHRFNLVTSLGDALDDFRLSSLMQ